MPKWKLKTIYDTNTREKRDMFSMDAGIFFALFSKEKKLEIYYEESYYTLKRRRL